MSKIYLCGITSQEYYNIKELTDPIWEIVDGLIFVVDEKASKDATDWLLEKRKGNGKIIRFPWMRQHDLTMNLWLHGSGILKTGDWCIFRDSMERFNPEWVKTVREFLDAMTFNGVNTIYNYGKIFAFRWHDGLFFQGSPHFGLSGARPKSIDLKEMFSEEKKEHTWRIKDGEVGGRPIDNKIEHEAKYVWTYGRSNHLLLGMEDEFEMFQRAEMIRNNIRQIAESGGYEFTIDGLIAFMRDFRDSNYDNFRIWINSHRVWKNFYRAKILGEYFSEIEKSENEWNLS